MTLDRQLGMFRAVNGGKSKGHPLKDGEVNP